MTNGSDVKYVFQLHVVSVASEASGCDVELRRGVALTEAGVLQVFGDVDRFAEYVIAGLFQTNHASHAWP